MMVFKVLQLCIALSIIIVCHETGHLLAARMLGVPVLNFDVGYGPAIVSWDQKNDAGNKKVHVSIRMLPFGGSVTVDPEHIDHITAEEAQKHQGEIQRTPLGYGWKKVVIYAMGPLASLLLGFMGILAMEVAHARVIGKISARKPVWLWQAILKFKEVLQSASLPVLSLLTFGKAGVQLVTPVGLIAGAKQNSDTNPSIPVRDSSNTSEHFVVPIANFSIFVGLLNLLPLPPFDGSGIVLGLVELCSIHLPEYMLAAYNGFGNAFLLALFGFAVFGDVRNVFGQKTTARGSDSKD